MPQPLLDNGPANNNRVSPRAPGISTCRLSSPTATPSRNLYILSHLIKGYSRIKVGLVLGKSNIETEEQGIFYNRKLGGLRRYSNVRCGGKKGSLETANIVAGQHPKTPLYYS